MRRPLRSRRWETNNRRQSMSHQASLRIRHQGCGGIPSDHPSGKKASEKATNQPGPASLLSMNGDSTRNQAQQKPSRVNQWLVPTNKTPTRRLSKRLGQHRLRNQSWVCKIPGEHAMSRKIWARFSGGPRAGGSTGGSEEVPLGCATGDESMHAARPEPCGGPILLTEGRLLPVGFGLTGAHDG
jgi:hypothetical protein